MQLPDFKNMSPLTESERNELRDFQSRLDRGEVTDEEAKQYEFKVDVPKLVVTRKKETSNKRRSKMQRASRQRNR